MVDKRDFKLIVCGYGGIWWFNCLLKCVFRDWIVMDLENKVLVFIKYVGNVNLLIIVV